MKKAQKNAAVTAELNDHEKQLKQIKEEIEERRRMLMQLESRSNKRSKEEDDADDEDDDDDDDDDDDSEDNNAAVKAKEKLHNTNMGSLEPAAKKIKMAI
jgi:chromosome segregation ATPase